MRIVVAETDLVRRSVPIVITVVTVSTCACRIVVLHGLLIPVVCISVIVISRGCQLRVAAREEDRQAPDQKDREEYRSQCFHRAPLDEFTTSFLAISMPEGFKKSADFRKKTSSSWRFEKGGKAECIAE